MRNEFMIDRNGKQFCMYAGLLDTAHQQGLKEIRTELLQVPSQDNGQVAIVQATVITEKGSFQGIGDASPQNVARAMLTCLIRLAETRAKARALRDAVNVGAACLDELDSAGGMDEGQPAGQPKVLHDAIVSPPAVPTLRTVPHITPESSPAPEGITDAQRRMIGALSKSRGQEVNLAGMTRREASQLISELKQQAASA